MDDSYRLDPEKRRLLEGLILGVKSGEVRPPPSSRKQFDKWHDDPVSYCHDFLKVILTEDQRRIARNIVTHPRLLVKASHGTGKTILAACLALWEHDCRVPSKVITTAPTQHQVKDLLWGELRRFAGKREGLMPSDTRLNVNEEHYIAGFTARTPDAFQGTHAEDMLIIFDEAVGIHSDFWTAAEGMLTGPDNRWLAICNPTDISSAAYQADMRPGSEWHVETIAGIGHPNVHAALAYRDGHGDLEGYRDPVPGAISLVWLESRIDEWCVPIQARDNEAGDLEWPPHSGVWHRPGPIFESRVLGRWPSTADDTVWSDKVWSACVDREPMGMPDVPPEIGCDVARFGCFDDKTEILTDAGWKLFPDLSGRERVLTLRGDVAEWGALGRVHAYPFDGLLNLSEGQVNFCITDNHNLVAASPHAPGRWEIGRYDDQPRHFLLRRDNTWAGTDPGAMTFTSRKAMPHGGERTRSRTFGQRDWFRFLGWYVGGGCVYEEHRAHGGSRICIAQRDDAKRASIASLLDDMGIRHRLSSRGRRIEFTNRAMADHLGLFGCGAHERHLLPYVKDATPELLGCFLETYRLGGGTHREGRRLSYTTSSRQLADDIQEILAKLGKAGKLTLKHRAGSATTMEGRGVIRAHDTYNVDERSLPRPAWIDKAKVARVPYEGTVYCATTPLRTIMVRRGGSVMWSGNSDYTAIHVRRGGVSLHHEWHQSWDGNMVCGRLKNLADEYAAAAGMDSGRTVLVKIDNTGDQAGGILDNRDGYRFRSIKSTQTSLQPRKYPNRRSELWFVASSMAGRREIDLTRLTDDMRDRLRGQLLTPKWRFDKAGRMEVEAKDVTKARLRASPDDADAFNLAYAKPGIEADPFMVKTGEIGITFGDYGADDWRRQLQHPDRG